MGRCFSFNETSEGKNFNYSSSKGTSTYTIYRTYNIPLIELNFDGWFESSARLWQKNNKARLNFLLLERTPPVHQTFLFHVKVEFSTLYFSLKKVAGNFSTILHTRARPPKIALRKKNFSKKTIGVLLFLLVTIIMICIFYW